MGEHTTIPTHINASMVREPSHVALPNLGGCPVRGDARRQTLSPFCRQGFMETKVGGGEGCAFELPFELEGGGGDGGRGTPYPRLGIFFSVVRLAAEHNPRLTFFQQI